jgi:hypothetical protein
MGLVGLSIVIPPSSDIDTKCCVQMHFYMLMVTINSSSGVLLYMGWWIGIVELYVSELALRPLFKWRWVRSQVYVLVTTTEQEQFWTCFLMPLESMGCLRVCVVTMDVKIKLSLYIWYCAEDSTGVYSSGDRKLCYVHSYLILIYASVYLILIYASVLLITPTLSACGLK